MDVNEFPARRQWLFKEESTFSVPYDFIEHIFIQQAQKEDVISRKETLIVTSLEADNKTRMLTLHTEIHKLSEN